MSASFRRVATETGKAPVLAFPDFSGSFVLDTDACDTGIGAVLSQMVGSVLWPMPVEYLVNLNGGTV